MSNKNQSRTLLIFSDLLSYQIEFQFACHTFKNAKESESESDEGSESEVSEESKSDGIGKSNSYT